MAFTVLHCPRCTRRICVIPSLMEKWIVCGACDLNFKAIDDLKHLPDETDNEMIARPGKPPAGDFLLYFSLVGSIAGCIGLVVLSIWWCFYAT